MANQTRTAEQSKPASGNGAQSDVARKIHATPNAVRVIDRMTDGLGLWPDRVDASLFLAALAVSQGAEPVAQEDLDEEPIEVGDLSSAVQGIDEAGELTLFKIVGGSDETLDTVLREDLTGLIEAGANILDPKLRGAKQAGAANALAELLDTDA